MSADRAYLDHNATTPLKPAVAEAMMHALNVYGNPSSGHAEGRKARALIDQARKAVAAAVSGEAKNVIFTSGATEALNTLLRPSPDIVSNSGAKRTDRLLVLATEHSAARAGGGFKADQIELIPVDSQGVIDLSWLESRLQALTDQDGFAPVTVAVQLANSETGVVQPMHDVSLLTQRFGALLVCDCVAAFGKIWLSMEAIRADAIVLSAHKFGGPKGVGAIVFNGERMQLAHPLVSGGGQEMRRRSGTENVVGIVGMGLAASQAIQSIDTEAERLNAMQDRLLNSFLEARPDIIVFGGQRHRLPNTLNIAIPGLKAEIALIRFDLAGVALSSGSACSSGKVARSQTLLAMGVAPEIAECALRFSLGHTTTQSDIDKTIEIFAQIAKALPKQSGLAA
jgi:cysteine desulfurase